MSERNIFVSAVSVECGCLMSLIGGSRTFVLGDRSSAEVSSIEAPSGWDLGRGVVPLPNGDGSWEGLCPLPRKGLYFFASEWCTLHPF